MALPLIPIAIFAGLGIGGYQFGRKAGENFGKFGALAAGAVAVYVAYGAIKK